MYYLKNNKTKDEFTAQGLAMAKEILAFDNLGEKEKQEYLRQVEIDRIKISELETALFKGGRKGRAESEAERNRLEADPKAKDAQLEAALARIAEP